MFLRQYRSLIGFARAGLAMIALTACSLPAWADQSAMIASIEGNAKDVKISRNGRLLKAAMGSMLRSKDNLIVSGSTKVRLDTQSGSTMVTASNSPFEVPSAGALGAADGLLENIANLLGWWSDNDTVDAAVRKDGKPSAPLLKTTQKVVAGSRRLAVAWIDRASRKPFKVEIRSRGNVLATVTSDTTSTVTPEIALVPGMLGVTITNAHGASASYQVSVEASGPENMPPSGTTSEANQLQAFLETAALAAAEGGAWRLEAYQRLVTMSGYEPAVLLAKALVNGEKL